MKQQMKLARVIVLVLTAALMALPATVHAAGEPHLRLSANKLKLKEGRKVTVDVLVRDAPQVYGVDVRLVFGPEMLEVVDADKRANGIQVRPGKFLDPKDGFILQHQVDNEAGTIDYALTLLNPAPPAEGNGMLMRITFRGKADGLATIMISEGLFGTQTGDTVQPALDQINIVVGDAPVPTPTGASVTKPATTSEEKEASSVLDPLVLIGGFAVVGLAGIGGGGWLWLKRVRYG